MVTGKTMNNSINLDHEKAPSRSGYEHTPLVRRTLSYDGVEPQHLAEPGERDCGESSGDPQSPLHVSFDVSQLNAYHYGDHSNEMLPPNSVRKNAGATQMPRQTKTPVRARFMKGGSSLRKATGKRTPVSAKRHKLFNRRSPPLHRTPAASRPFFLDTSTESANTHQSLFSSSRSLHAPNSIWKQSDSRTKSQPFPAAPLFMEPTATPAPKTTTKRSLGTVTTVANTTILEMTAESDDSRDSHGNDAAAQTFQFSSFPASLPRIPAHAHPKRITLSSDKGSHSFQPSVLPDLSGVQSSVKADENLSSTDPSIFAGSSEQELEDMIDDDMSSTSPLGTPVGRRKLNFNTVLSPSGSEPGTPKDVRMHFQSKECSPIRRDPDDDVPAKKDSHILNHSLGSTSTSTDRSGGSSSRPMPDMNAFDPDASLDSENGGVSVRSHPQSPKLLCPPTPVRTPAWAHGDNDNDISHASPSKGVYPPHAKWGRQNSLIATKVLATCSQRDIEGRTSLENSLMEDDGSKCLGRSHELSGNTSSILTGNTSGLLSECAEHATEAETDTYVSDRERSLHYSHDNSQSSEADEDYSWLHDRRKDHRLFDQAVQEPSLQSTNVEVVSLATSFEILGVLGRGTFADVFKVRSKKDGNLYAVKKHRRQFRGRRDRDMTMAEVRYMQRLQSTSSLSAKSNNCLYLLFFYQAWQEEGHFFCQTELCCRDTCREFMDSLRMNWVSSRSRYPCLQRLAAPLGIVSGSDQDIIGRMVPEQTIWKICHDVGAGLSHIHQASLVHHDIKPSNIFFVAHPVFGAMCKIGDFGMAGDIGTSEDGQEGDQKYMAPELLASDVKHPSADMFSFGLMLYELASALSFEVPAEGNLWHELRSGKKPSNSASELPSSRDPELVQLINVLTSPHPDKRPSASTILQNRKVQIIGTQKEEFLCAYIKDVENYEQRMQDMEAVSLQSDEQTPRVLGHRPRLCVSPSLGMPAVPTIFSSPKQAPPFA